MLTKCQTAFSLIFVHQRVIPQSEATKVVHLWSEFRGLVSDSFPAKSVCLRVPLKKKVKVENSCLSVNHHTTQNNSIHFQVKSHFA